MSMMGRPSPSDTSRCAGFSSGACVPQYATITRSIGSSGRCAVSRSATVSASARVAGLSSISIPATSSTITPRCIQRSVWRAKIRLRWLQRSVIASLNATVHYAMLAGIDLGGTQVRVALARSDGQLITSIKTKTRLLPTPQPMVDWAAAAIDKHRGREKGRGITIAAPGPIDLKRGVLVNPPNLPWQNVPLVAMMSQATGARVHLAHDADMAGLCGIYHAAVRGAGTMLVLYRANGGGDGAVFDDNVNPAAGATAA